MARLFTADPHYFHSGVLEMCNRHFQNIDQHDEHLLQMTNDYVKKSDELWVLGDVAWGDPGNVLKRINCRNIHLIWGNHDKPGFAKYFKSAQDTMVLKVKEHRIFLSHYAHAFWPGSHRGWMHLYGHNHAQRETYLDELWPGRRSMDCGVDNAARLFYQYRPFHEDEIIDLLAQRPGHDDVEFYINQQRGPVV